MKNIINCYMCGCEIGKGKLHINEIVLCSECEIEKKYSEYSKIKITQTNRCQHSRENETLRESIARHKGILSGLLTAKNIIETIKGDE